MDKQGEKIECPYFVKLQLGYYAQQNSLFRYGMQGHAPRKRSGKFY